VLVGGQQGGLLLNDLEEAFLLSGLVGHDSPFLGVDKSNYTSAIGFWVMRGYKEDNPVAQP
jgi:ATP-dependent RNA circularization protein (DNA/RNA ligase family)